MGGAREPFESTHLRRVRFNKAKQLTKGGKTIITVTFFEVRNKYNKR
jgi:hypothetical protein